MLSALALSVSDGPVEEGVDAVAGPAAEDEEDEGMEAVFAFVFR